MIANVRNYSDCEALDAARWGEPSDVNEWGAVEKGLE